MSRCPSETDTVLLLTEAFDPSELDGCQIPENFTFRIPYNETKMPDETPEHYAPEEPTSPPTPAEPTLAPVAETPSANTLSSLSEAPPVADLSGLKDMAGDNSVLMVILALVAVLGAGRRGSSTSRTRPRSMSRRCGSWIWKPRR